MLEPDTLLNERYRLLEPIGEGGMATVYRAVDSRLGRTVAVKVLHPEYGRDRPFLQRFQQEAEFAAGLGAHPNIVAIYDIGQDAGLRYIVMELVEGRNLKDVIRERGAFPVTSAFSITRQVASALDFAHHRGLVHRDIKPQNIMVTEAGVAKVTDFGIARSLSASQLTRTGMVIGTAHYFSPEQAQGLAASPASDIYSLGVVLYEMVTGHLPFDAESPIGVAMQHLHSSPPPPWEYNPNLSTRTAAVILRALEKEPERRYRDAAEFSSALSTQIGSDAGATTTVSPLRSAPAEKTRVVPAMDPAPSAPLRRRTVEEPVEHRTASAGATPTNGWRRALLPLAVFLVAAAIAATAFFVTNRAFGGTSATPTPTDTPIPTPKPRRHHVVPTVPVQIIVPTSTPFIPLPTFTPVPVYPTFTPVPPTAVTTPTAKPAPRPTPPRPTSTPLSPFPPDTPTPVG